MDFHDDVPQKSSVICDDDCCKEDNNTEDCCDSCEENQNKPVISEDCCQTEDDCECCHQEEENLTEDKESLIKSDSTAPNTDNTTHNATNWSLRSMVEDWWYQKKGYSKPIEENLLPMDQLSKQKDVSVTMPIVVSFFNVEGMTCTGCVTQLESHLKSIPGIQETKISLLTHKAEISYYQGIISQLEISQCIKQAGFTPQILNADNSSVNMLVSTSMLNPKGVQQLMTSITSRLDSMQGIIEVQIEEQPSDKCIKVIVQYDPDVTGVRFIKEATELIAQQPVTLASSSSTQGKSQNELKWRNYLIICTTLTIPLVFLCYILPLIPSIKSVLDHEIIGRMSVVTLISFLLTTPIQFGVGKSIYISAYQSLKYAKMANMDFLVMLSTTVAYGFSVVSAIISMSSHTKLDTFFETSAILLTLIVLGRYLEILTKDKAGNILKSVLLLQPSHAILVTVKGLPAPTSTSCCDPQSPNSCCKPAIPQSLDNCGKGSKDACCEESLSKDCCGSDAMPEDDCCEDDCCGKSNQESQKGHPILAEDHKEDECCKDSCCDDSGCCDNDPTKPQEPTCNENQECKSGCCSKDIIEEDNCCGQDNEQAKHEDTGCCEKKSQPDCCEDDCCTNPNKNSSGCNINDSVPVNEEDDCCKDDCCGQEIEQDKSCCDEDSGCCKKEQDSSCCDDTKAQRTTNTSVKVQKLIEEFSGLEIINEQLTSVDYIHRGDIIKVTSGTKIPCDGIIVNGTTQVDESMITGESILNTKKPGDYVIGGTINQHGLIYVKVERLHNESFISSIYKLIESAQSSKTQVQRVADIVASYFVPAIVALSLITFIIWYIVASNTTISTNNLSDFTFALFFAITVLIISCPCAVSLASPTAILVGTSVAAKFGIIVKSGVSLENAYKTKIVVFDKTGTITLGKPVVTECLSFSKQHDTNAVLFYAASCERGSNHIIGQAIVSHAETLINNVATPSNFVSLSDSNGVKCTVNSLTVVVGNEECVSKHKIAISDIIQQKATQLQNDGKTTVFVVVDGELIGLIALIDEPRKEAAFVVAQMEKMGMQVWMMSGDNQKSVDRIAQKIGIKQSHAIGNLLPSQKTLKVLELQKTGFVVSMIGDGVNDSAALVQSDVGIAVASSTDIAIEAANVILLKHNLSDLLLLFDISAATFSQIRKNFMWAFLYNFIGIPLSCGLLWPTIHIAIPPAIAGISELFSSVPVILLSLTLQWYKPADSILFKS